ncbi:NAD-dependent epimerase/dehydratase family protein [Brevibacterium litoralis]|uniref:NAD-dependent epimerase/dehydratase family protein n=1 Tax=Brevibacterium litoralis TaxID=3138935 RepID=UPI0032EE0A18
MERVVITGASGFLGSHAAQEFAAHGYAVTVAGRNAAALPRRYEQHVLDRFVGDLDALADADLAAHPHLRADVVVHCAALSTPWGRWSDFVNANIHGTERAWRLARRVGARRLVHVSSPSIYAATRDFHGIREDEVDPSNRLTHYIRSKIAAEALLAARAHLSGAPEVVVLRPRGLIGRGDPSMVPRILDVHDRLGVPLFDGGRNLVDVTPVRDGARALRLAAEAGPEAAGRAFNITGGDPRPFRDLVERLLHLTGRTPRFRHLDRRVAYAAATAAEAVCTLLPHRPEPPVMRYTISTVAHSQTLDISAAREVLGYEPAHSIDAALAEYGDTQYGDSDAQCEHA